VADPVLDDVAVVAHPILLDDGEVILAVLECRGAILRPGLQDPDVRLVGIELQGAGTVAGADLPDRRAAEGVLVDERFRDVTIAVLLDEGAAMRGAALDDDQLVAGPVLDPAALDGAGVDLEDAGDVGGAVLVDEARHVVGVFLPERGVVGLADLRDDAPRRDAAEPGLREAGVIAGAGLLDLRIVTTGVVDLA